MRKARRWQSQMNMGRIELPWPMPALRCHVIGIDCSRPSRSRAEIVTYLRSGRVPTPYLQALPNSPSLTHAFAKAGRTTLATSA